MKARLLLFALFLANLFTSFAFAGATEQPLPPQDFLTQIVTTLHGAGELSGLMKISAVITLLVSSMKVSVLNQYVWSKLGAAQVYVAPLLGIVIGLITLAASGQPITAGAVFTYLVSGGGAVFLHEMLDSVKQIPGIGGFYVAGISVLEKFLGGGSKSTPPAGKDAPAG